MRGLMRGMIAVVSAIAAIGCESASNGGAAGTGVAGMVATGGVSGMLATGGASGASGMTGGTGGMVNTTPGGAPTFTAIYDELLTKGRTGNCTFGACHGAAPGPTNGMLQMSAADKLVTYNALVNVPSISGNCGPRTLVVPGQPEESLFMLKLRPMPPCGDRMPVAGLGTHFSEGQLEQVRMWIQNGALND